MPTGADRQARVLEYVLEHSREHGAPPSIREICERTGLRSTSTARYYLDRLQAAGTLDWTPRVSRGLRVPGMHAIMEGDPVTVRDAAGELVTGELVAVGGAE